MSVWISIELNDQIFGTLACFSMKKSQISFNKEPKSVKFFWKFQTVGISLLTHIELWKDVVANIN